MSDKSAIEWTDATWTPIRARNLSNGKVGWFCEHATTGCEFCYAEGFNMRLGTDLPFKPGHRKDVELFLDETMLLAPLKWKKPRMIFVCSMTDLFADFVPDEWIDKMFAIMALSPQHTFQILTKRAARMRDYFSKQVEREGMIDCSRADRIGDVMLIHHKIDSGFKCVSWPLPNVWLGVSTERQQEAEMRIPLLLQTPAAIRFISAEPLLGPVYLTPRLHDSDCDIREHGVAGVCTCAEPREVSLDWVIVGGESGPGARPMHPDWARSLRDQCQGAGVKYFFKQWGEWTPGENVERVRGTVETAKWFNERWLFDRENLANYEGHADDEPDLYRVGKKAAGRLLDGAEYNDMPERGRDAN